MDSIYFIVSGVVEILRGREKVLVVSKNAILGLSEFVKDEDLDLSVFDRVNGSGLVEKSDGER